MPTPQTGAWHSCRNVRFALFLLFLLTAGASQAQLSIHQHIVGRNEQVLILDHATVLNLSRDGATAEMNLASTVGPGEVQGSKRTVVVRGAIVNIAEGHDRTASVNIGTVQARAR